MKKNLIVLFLSIFIGLVLAEIILRIFTPFPVKTLRIIKKIDPILRVKLKHDFKEIDANGFRNPDVLRKVDIVALGDSHTYGNNVKSEFSWPQVLSRKGNKSVYNLGVGGYGPLQYAHLFDRAVELNPDNIVVGLYLFNDLQDICKILIKLSYWQEWARDNNFDYEPCLEKKKKSDYYYQTDLTLKTLSFLQNSALFSAVDHLFLGNQQLIGRQMFRLRELEFPESMGWENIRINDANIKTRINYLQVYNGAESTGPVAQTF